MNRRNVIARIDCLTSDSCPLTKGLPTYIEVEVAFNDGSVPRARGGKSPKRYEANAQLKSRDGSFVKAYGGKGVTMGLKEAVRFSAKTLESLSLPSADVEKLVARVCEMSGLTLSEKGEAQMAYLKDTEAAKETA